MTQYLRVVSESAGQRKKPRKLGRNGSCIDGNGQLRASSLLVVTYVNAKVTDRRATNTHNKRRFQCVGLGLVFTGVLVSR